MSRRTKLSKSLLEMKFMKKSKTEIENEEDAHRAHIHQEESCAQKAVSSGNFIIEASFVPCEDITVGRLSFKGMNPEIERLMEVECDPFAEGPIAIINEETDITDEQMALQMYPKIKRSKRKSEDKGEQSKNKRLKFDSVENKNKSKRLKYESSRKNKRL